MMLVVLLVVGALALPCGLYAYAASPLAWGLLRDTAVRVRGGAYRGYREAPQARWVEGRAPVAVRVAAFTSFCLGQMVIPGIPLAIFGAIILLLLVRHDGPVFLLLFSVLSAPTGILVAARLLGAGFALLHRAPDGADRARAAATWELGHNAALFVLAAIFLLAGVENSEARLGVELTLGLSVLASLHALLLFTAARELDAYNAAAEEPASPPIPA